MIPSINILIILVSAVLILPVPALSWDFTKHSVNVEDIISGGPPKDGIPALFNPKYVPAIKADFMKEAEDVIGVELNGVARAYPIRIMSWHELINDRFGDRLALVSW